jgi:cytochrome c oxidase accessory protein FixG
VTAPAPEATEKVLSTLNSDGSRRWLEPRLSRGRFLRRRFAVAWGLIALFTLLPYLRINGKPPILLDVPNRRFTLFGTTFLPTDTMFLMLLLLGIFVTIFLLTALFGRVWCGWACPQTVYLEFVYRPIERLTGGKSPWSRKLGLDRFPSGVRRIVRFVLYVALSMFLAHTFLAYFVGVESLARWVRSSPFVHPVAFAVMALTTVLMLLDFAWFREQVCLVACPYGRFQSVLLDRRSVIVGYDPHRGEPRRRPRDREPGETAGDCIDCGACVITCPTGIDIRDGLQMECVHCTQCIDACDAIMDRVGKPRGLIRYSSQAELADEPHRMLRPRVIAYPVLLLVVVGLLSTTLARRQSADVTVLRGLGTPYAELGSGLISNQLRVKVVNRTEEPRAYTVEVLDEPAIEIVSPDNPLNLDAGAAGTAILFLNAPRELFRGGGHELRLRVSDGVDFDRTMDWKILGPFDGAIGGAP